MPGLPLHPACCGPCGDCREALADYAKIHTYAKQLDSDPEQVRAERAYWKLFWPPVLKEALERHVRRYGDDGCFTNSTAKRGEPAQRLW